MMQGVLLQDSSNSGRAQMRGMHHNDPRRLQWQTFLIDLDVEASSEDLGSIIDITGKCVQHFPQSFHQLLVLH